MKTIIFICALALTLPILGCQQDPSSPATPDGVLNATLEVPRPVLVPYTNIPYPYPNTLYRIAGAELAQGPVVILERVLDEGFDMTRAWHPQIYICMAVFLDELIIELEEPNDDIYDLGFTSDFTGTAGSCARFWNEYRFMEDDPDIDLNRRCAHRPKRR
ncbi:MAG: hypothetical protein JSW58_09445 [Candidatus Latescibacterota bacterium]|nr:MAG: hypothetical protein JSW58_09445 [Candidatus Latescibacterota bacterium]